MEVLFVRAKSGQIHKMFSPGETYPLASFEGCNLDDATVEFIHDVPESTEDLCRRCFPNSMEEYDDPRT